MLNTLPKAVIFDWDNTLVDTLPLVRQAVNETFAHFGLEGNLTLEQVHRQTSQSAKDLFPRIFGEKAEEAKTFYYEKYYTLSQDKIIPLPGALGLLKLFADQKIYMSIVSNKRGPKLREEVETLGLTHYFQEIVGSADCAYDKPSPVCVDRALIHLSGSVSRSQIWFVGDTWGDYLAAENAGCVPVLVAEVEDVTDDCARFDGCVALANHCLALTVKI